jgi:hypothetical protein
VGKRTGLRKGLTSNDASKCVTGTIAQRSQRARAQALKASGMHAVCSRLKPNVSSATARNQDIRGQASRYKVASPRYNGSQLRQGNGFQSSLTMHQLHSWSLRQHLLTG